MCERTQRDGKAMGDRFTTLPELLFDGSFTRTTDAQISFATLDTVRFARTVCIHEIHGMFVPQHISSHQGTLYTIPLPTAT